MANEGRIYANSLRQVNSRKKALENNEKHRRGTGARTCDLFSHDSLHGIIQLVSVSVPAAPGEGIGKGSG